MKPTAPPEAFTREYALEPDMPGLPERVTDSLDTPEHKAWLRDWNESNALDRERDTLRALDEAGVPYFVDIRPGVKSSSPADRVKWLATQAKATPHGSLNAEVAQPTE